MCRRISLFLVFIASTTTVIAQQGCSRFHSQNSTAASVTCATSLPSAGAISTIQTTSVGWVWGGPQPVYKMVAADGVDLSNGHQNASVNTKYGNLSGWALALGGPNGRLIHQGINTAGQYSYTYSSNYPTNAIPYVPTEDMGLYAQQDSKSYHIKDLSYVANPTGMACNGSGYYQGEEPDPFDPNAQSANSSLWSASGSIYSASTDNQARYYVPDDGDSLFLIDSVPTHPDGGLVIAANSPVQAVSDPNQGVGGSYTFPNATYWAKIGLADYLAAEYGCVGTAVTITSASESGYIVTATTSAPHGFVAGQIVVISGMSPSGYNNSGYPVIVMPQGLTSTQFEYTVPAYNLSAGSGGSASPEASPFSSDPLSIPYCGSSLAASSLSALKTAWNVSAYTTWGTSDSGGLTGIANNTYSSWGTGTGFLDENGKHILSASVQSTCGTNLPVYGSGWGNTTQVNSDLDQFMGAVAGLHMLHQYVGYHAVCGSSCPPLVNLIYDGPTEVYQQASPYLDAIDIHPFYYSTLAEQEARIQFIVDNDGGKPVIVHDYSGAPPESCTSSPECQSTQAARGTELASYWSQALKIKNPLGKYAVIGLDHWMYYDWSNGSSNGFVTVNDNEYDGSEDSTLSSNSTWQANYSYSSPARVMDANGSNETLGITSPNCTSGSNSPTWALGYGQITTDGSCLWFNDNSYPITSEPSDYGNFLEPVTALLNETLCDQ